MQLKWKTAAAAAALLAAPLARAHEVICEKTVNGVQTLEVTSYPTTLNYQIVLENVSSSASIVTSVTDPMFPTIPVTLPLTLPLEGSTSTITLPPLVIDTFEECEELATTDGPPPAIVNTVTVGFDGGTNTCWAKVICKPPDENGEGCLTRTPGYWATHPEVTAAFLPVESCGLELGETTAGLDGSITEDLCSVGTDHKVYGSPQEAQLVRQCAAAALNIAASEELGGSCEAFTERFAECCSADLCGEDATASEITASGCIEDLDEFNNSADTLLEDSEEINLCQALELGPPCSADPAQCQAARGNGVINDRSEAFTTTATSTLAAPQPTSGGCAGGPGGVLALLGTAGLLGALRRRR